MDSHYKKKCRTMFLIIVGWICVANAEVSPELTFDDLKAGIEMRQNLLNRVQTDFTYSSTYLDGPINKTENSVSQYAPFSIKKYSVLRADDKIRVCQSIYDVYDTGVSELYKIEHFAWNGEKFTGYAEPQDDTNSRVSGSVSNERNYILNAGFWRTPLEQQIFDLDCTLSEVLTQAEWELSGPEQIGDSKVWCLKSIGLEEGYSTLKVWIDPERDFAPVQMEFRMKIDGQKEIIEKMTNVKLEQEDGLWVIKDATVLLENPFLKKHKYGAMRFSTENYQLGVDVQDSDFEIVFPEGTWVYDEIIEMGYIVGEGTWITHPDGTNEFVSTGNPDNLQDIPELVTQVEASAEKPDINEKIVEDAVNLPIASSTSNIESDVTSNDQMIFFLVLSLFIIALIAIVSVFIRRKRC